MERLKYLPIFYDILGMPILRYIWDANALEATKPFGKNPPSVVKMFAIS